MASYYTNAQVSEKEATKIISEENPCRTESKARTKSSFVLNKKPSASFPLQSISIYAGVTSEGDIAIINRNNGKVNLDLYICNRPIATDKVTITQRFHKSLNSSCKVGLILDGGVEIGDPTEGYQYMLNFRTINLKSQGIESSLCEPTNSREFLNISEEERSNQEKSNSQESPTQNKSSSAKQQ